MDYPISPVSRFRGSGAKAYMYLANMLIMKGKIGRSVKAYRDLAMSLTGSPIDWSHRAFPEQEYIVNEQYKFIYCPIPKVACSSIKRVMVELSDLADKPEILQLPNDFFHTYIHHNLTLSAVYSPTEALQLMESEQYFKFAFVRNPWSRLVSAYLNKFVEIPLVAGQSFPPDNAKSVINAIYLESGIKPDYQKSVSFRQFANYVAKTKDKDLDGHWKSQSTFLGNHQFDFIGRLENLANDFSQIKDTLGISITLPWENRSSVKHSNTHETQQDGFADMSPRELRKLKILPKYPSFYSAELIKLVEEKYAGDIERFDYTF